MSRADVPGVVRLGTSLEQPDTINDAVTDAGWRLDYYARVDDRQQAHAAASSFLGPFRRERHLYETDAVVAATAIENSRVPIQFRKTSFRDSPNRRTTAPINPIDTEVDRNSDNGMESEESAETRQTRQRAVAKLLFDAEQLLEESELVTGPVAYDKPPATLLNGSRNGSAGQTAVLTSDHDALNHRSPLNDLVAGELPGSAPVTRTPPPGNPNPGRTRPAALNGASRNPPDTSSAAQAEYNDAISQFDADGSTTDATAHNATARNATAPDTAVDARVHDEPDTEFTYDSSKLQDESILVQMERLIVQREARQNLRNIRGRIGWATLKGIPLGAISGFLLVLALNVPDDPALLVGFVLTGAVAGASIMGLYQSSRLWGSASHWRRVSRHA